MLRVLIVDDEFDARDNMIAIIDWKSHGITVAAALDNGVSAYEYILSHEPDIVSIDIQMRGMSGLEVIEKVRAADCVQPVFIIISGYEDFTYTQKAIHLKVDGYLLKPFRPQDVIQIIERHFNSTEASQSIVRELPGFGALLMKLSQSGAGLSRYPIQAEAFIISAMLNGTPDQLRLALAEFSKAVASEELFCALNSHLILYAELCRHWDRPSLNSEIQDIHWDEEDPVGSIRKLVLSVALECQQSLSLRVARGSVPALRAKAYIDKHYAQSLSLESVARAVSVTPTYLSGCFARDVGMGFVDYVKSVRIAHAKRMLSDTDMGIDDVSQACGYPDTKYFKQVFRQLTGLSPFSYRQQFLANKNS